MIKVFIKILGDLNVLIKKLLQNMGILRVLTVLVAFNIFYYIYFV